MKLLGHFPEGGYRKSFGIKIFLAFVVVIILVSTGFTGLSIYHESTAMKESLNKEGMILSALLAYNARAGVFAENTEMLRDTVTGVMDQKHAVAVSVHTADLKPLLAEAKKTVAGKARAAAVFDERLVLKLKAQADFETVDKEETISFIKPVIMETFPSAEALFFENAGDAKTKTVIGYVTVILDKTAMKREIRSVLLKNFMMTLLFILTGAALVYFVVRKITTPLARLTESVKMLGLGENVGRVPVESEDEIGRLAGAFNIMSENLERREAEKSALEEKLAHAKKMEAVGDFARGLAHDFNNLLTTVHGFVFLLKKKIEETSPLQQYLAKMNTTLTKTRELTDTLLTYSRGTYINPSRVDINKMLEKIGEAISCVAGETVTYRARYSEEPVTVLADRLQLEQVLMNLAHNACDAMPDGGELTITVGTVVVEEGDSRGKSLKAPGEYVLITMADTGSGMSDIVKERMFEPFFTTKERGKGTGLGLYIVYGIIDQYKGYIEIDSRESEGTVFNIYLPRAAEGGSGDEKAPEVMITRRAEIAAKSLAHGTGDPLAENAPATLTS